MFITTRSHIFLPVTHKLKCGTVGAIVAIDYKEFIIKLININLPLTAIEVQEKIEKQQPRKYLCLEYIHD